MGSVASIVQLCIQLTRPQSVIAKFERNLTALYQKLYRVRLWCCNVECTAAATVAGKAYKVQSELHTAGEPKYDDVQAAPVNKAADLNMSY